MKKVILAVACIAFAMTSCKKENKADSDGAKTEKSSTSLAKSSENVLDWDGTYKGVTPCADCEGIETTVTLNRDKTYVMTTKYQGKGNDILQVTGSFSWSDDGSTVKLENIKDGPNQFLVGANQLTMLDMEGKKITGALAKKYVLNKEMNAPEN